jgi:hypothetical protein
VMYRVDITAYLNDEDETGYLWTFLDEARDPGQIMPGALVVAGDEDTIPGLRPGAVSAGAAATGAGLLSAADRCAASGVTCLRARPGESVPWQAARLRRVAERLIGGRWPVRCLG